MARFSRDQRIDQRSDPAWIKLAISKTCSQHSTRKPANFLVTLFCFGELFFDFLRIELALLDLAPPLFQQCKDRFVSESLQKERNNAEANNLRQKQLPVPAECFSCFAQDVGHASAAGGNYQVHKLGFGRNIDCLPGEN